MHLACHPASTVFRLPFLIIVEGLVSTGIAYKIIGASVYRRIIKNVFYNYHSVLLLGKPNSFMELTMKETDQLQICSYSLECTPW